MCSFGHFPYIQLNMLVCVTLHQSMAILDHLSMRKILLYIGSASDQISTAMAYVLQNIINAISNLENIKKEREKHEAKRKAEPAARMRPFPFCFEKIGRFCFNF